MLENLTKAQVKKLAKLQEEIDALIKKRRKLYLLYYGRARKRTKQLESHINKITKMKDERQMTLKELAAFFDITEMQMQCIIYKNNFPMKLRRKVMARYYRWRKLHETKQAE